MTPLIGPHGRLIKNMLQCSYKCKYYGIFIMRKIAVIRARVEPELKASVEDILEHLGLTTSQAITLFLKQIELQKGIPFRVNIPNAETVKVLKEAEQDINIVKSKDMNELLQKLQLDKKENR